MNVGTYRGKPVLSWFQGVVTGSHGVGYGLGHYQIVDTNYRPVATVSGQNGFQGDLHEFILTPEGTALFTCYGSAVANMRIGGVAHQVPYLFGVVQEVDVATGKLLFQWRTDQHVPLTDSYKAPVLQPGWVWDYFHINAISIDPSDGNLVISGRNTCACYKVNRRTGKVMWRLGGKHSDFQMAAGTRFYYQHDVNMHDDGVMTVFDNEGGPPQRAAHSRALVLNVDQRRRQVTLRHAFQHQPQVYSDALGSVQPLAGNDWFVGWGRSTNFTKYSRHRPRAVRRSPDPGRQLVPSVPAALDRNPDGAAGPRRGRIRQHRDPLRILERLDRAEQLARAGRPGDDAADADRNRADHRF